jgi:DNA-binding transcriptional LysR family regulator
MRFTLKQIEYFVAAGERGSITFASDKMNISQPSISAAIAHLEAEFGVQLFIRHHAQGLSLTPEGMRLLRDARALLRQAEELQSVAGELSDQVSGPLSIGCLVTVYPLLVPELVHSFRKRYASARVHAVASDQSGLFERLRSGEITIAVTYDMSVPADLEFEPLAQLPPFAFVAAGHPLARHRRLSLRALAEEPFLLLDLPHSREYFLALFRQLGLAPRMAGRFEHMDVIRSLVARGDGFGLANIKPRMRSSLDGRRLAYLDLQDEFPPLILGLASVRGMHHTRTAEAFLGLCRELVRDGQVPGTA